MRKRDEMIMRAVMRCQNMADNNSMSLDQMKVAQRYFILTFRLLPPPPPLNAWYEGVRLILIHSYEKLREACLSRHKFCLPLYKNMNAQDILKKRGFKIEGYLDLQDTDITSLPKGLIVGGSIELKECTDILPQERRNVVGRATLVETKA